MWKSYLKQSKHIRKIYYWTSSRFYRSLWSIQRDISKYDAPVDPAKIVWVDPDKITRFTGRSGEFWKNRTSQIGSVQGGSWDFVGDPFRNHWIHKSFEDRFINGLDWTETDLYDRLTTNPKVSDEDRRCESYDRLYNDLASGNYLTQYELAISSANYAKSYPALICNEVTVDIGRDGEFLLVDGKHRLSAAKILGLETIPITILTRHEKWMEYIDEIWTDVEEENHADLKQFETS